MSHPSYITECPPPVSMKPKCLPITILFDWTSSCRIAWVSLAKMWVRKSNKMNGYKFGAFAKQSTPHYKSMTHEEVVLAIGSGQKIEKTQLVSAKSIWLNHWHVLDRFDGCIAAKQVWVRQKSFALVFAWYVFALWCWLRALSPSLDLVYSLKTDTLCIVVARAIQKLEYLCFMSGIIAFNLNKPSSGHTNSIFSLFWGRSLFRSQCLAHIAYYKSTSRYYWLRLLKLEQI